MVTRLVRFVVGLALVATPALAMVPSAVAAPDFSISASSGFSPNGDGAQDTLRIRYTVPSRTHVHLAISGDGTRRVHRRVDLGVQARGTHVWTWDGRNQSGRTLPDKAYVIRMYDAAGTGAPDVVADTETRIDTALATELTTPTFGAGRKAVARVYPRTTVVTDAIDLRAIAFEDEVSSLELVIRNAKGRVVRRADVDEPIPYATGGGVYAIGRTVPWAAVRGGRPLPRGRYTAVVVGGDAAGNTGRSAPLRIWVSADRLEWQETTTTVTPLESRVGVCSYDTANGCGDLEPCGQVVPSSMYSGGLSYRPAACVPADSRRTDAAVGRHMLEVPEATGVRGLAAVRVSFVGAPTTAGEPDTGTLSVAGASGSSVVGTSGQSAWVEEPAWGGGLDRSYPLPQRDPAALWSFATTGTSSVDIATFTVDVRYLAVAD